MTDVDRAALLRELIGLFSSNIALPVILFIAWWTERKRHWTITDQASERLNNAIQHYRNVTAQNAIINAPRARPHDLT